MNRSTRLRPESADPFAMQLALSRVHARLVPMQLGERGYALDPSAEGWFELPAGRGFAGYGLARALRMLLDVLRGLTALHDTFDAEGINFAHGEVALTHLRVDNEGVCRLVPLAARHSAADSRPPVEALGHLAPERLLGEPVDARADVFSAGVLLWEALAGRRLFSETSSEAIIDRLMGEKLQMPQLPPELAWAIPLKSIAARALSVDPYQRFADCAELATAIAIVARERVATHAEITAFFGPNLRSSGSVAQPRPVPSRSSTFPSVSLPVAPVSISAPASSRNGFPLATPAPRSVSSASRSVTPAPRSVTPAPRSVTPAPRSVSSASRSITPVPRSITPAPTSSAPGPATQRNATHKSPFATLIGTGELVPASHRRKTLMSVGTPASVLDSADVAPASTERLSKLPPPLPVWPDGMPSAPSLSSQVPTSSSAVVARATLESIPIAEEVAKLRGSPSRRSLIALAVVTVIGIAIALVAGGSSNEVAVNSAPVHAQPPAPVLAQPAPQPAPAADEHDRSAPASHPASELSNGPPASTPKELRPAAKAASPKPASAGIKDYGI